jgi:hypothetical protein
MVLTVFFYAEFSVTRSANVEVLPRFIAPDIPALVRAHQAQKLYNSTIHDDIMEQALTGRQSPASTSGVASTNKRSN